MQRRYLLFLCTCLAILSAGMAVVKHLFVAPTLPPFKTNITLENARRVQKGWTRGEVEALLGPPRDESSVPAVGGSWIQKGEPNVVKWDWWTSDEVDLRLGFDRQGKVIVLYLFLPPSGDRPEGHAP